jgi:3-isopropylmalate/(R)-2-methylmalate dehydratase large subunit
MEGRMTVCNMSIEMGARGGLIAPDDTTMKYLRDLPSFPRGFDWDSLLTQWSSFQSDRGALLTASLISTAA